MDLLSFSRTEGGDSGITGDASLAVDTIDFSRPARRAR
jgi:hypothetical protein